MRSLLKKISAFLFQENRLLVFTLSFLVLFSFGSYALASALYRPSDNVTDPSCAPGTAGCYVDTAASDTLEDVLGRSGGANNGGTSIIGQSFLKFDGTGEPGILNSGGHAILGNDVNDNLTLSGYDTLGALQGSMGFNSDGTIALDAPSITAHARVGSGQNAYSTTGTLNLDLGEGSFNGSFNSYSDTTLGNQDIVGAAKFGVFSNDSALLLHTQGSQGVSFAEASSAGGLPLFTTGALNSATGDSIVSTLTSSAYTVSNFGNQKMLSIDTDRDLFQLGDIGGSINSTLLSVNDATNTITAGGYVDASSSPTFSSPSHSGSGLNDMSVGGSYSPAYGNTYKVTIDGVNDGDLAYTITSGGPFEAGEVLTETSGPGTGTHATVILDTGSAVEYANPTTVGSGFTVGATITGGTSGTVATIVHTASAADSFSWTSLDGGSDSNVRMTGSAQTLNDGVTVTFAATTGHKLSDIWTFKYRYPAGTMLSLDGQNGIFSIGDVDGVLNGTGVLIDDPSDTITLFGDTDLSGDAIVEGGLMLPNLTPGVACDDSSHALGYDTSGTVVCNSSVSDQRLKNNITSLDDTTGLAAIEALNPVSYYWKDTSLPGTGTTAEQFGFIAQDVQKILPNLVTINPPTYLTPDVTYGLNYQGFTAVAVEAIKELDLKVEPLTSIDPTVNGSLASLIVQFLQNAVVSIKEATIGTLHIGDQVCADDVCVTKEQFKNLLIQAGGVSSTPPPAPITPPSDPAPVVPPPTADDTTSDTSTSTPVVVPDPGTGDSDSVATPPADPTPDDSGTTVSTSTPAS